ncbi:tRNA (adenosine(37)-N6)-dimethylallyltransferase MiaA [Parasporobacterium paucivorans]|uniref:tRNA dimethylallyltransferase n=1 Tax=Parasporobacterium paucivorans DSM 15970 TaxID=1122934 RepID=A0A1M6A295_9FIRM|nr:tRNA (adenosine(37)-N6)-dimethylallyltransferase MiaA [Parasporobacterium paucivorans]SHI30565.1 tRNA dimethylallyltransferase [Parasporobacterium paucivorans DSM 15970]
MKKPLVVLTGPTSVGKTDLSIRLARQINGEIISADSIQVYRYMDIGSAKISPEEMQGITHHLIDEIDPDEEFNVVRFKELTQKYLDDIYSKNKIPIIVGGTGFYIQSVLYDIDFTDAVEDISIRRELEEILDRKGKFFLHQLLADADIESARKIHYNNTRRVIRALEFYRLTGNKISEHNSIQQGNASPYNFAYFVLNRDRRQLYDNIDFRVEKMLKDGLMEEVRHLLEMGYSRDLISMQGVGYKEMAAYMDGESSLDETVDLIKKNTRHFAKRQITWFKREKKVIWTNFEDFDNEQDRILDFMLKVLQDKEII